MERGLRGETIPYILGLSRIHHWRLSPQHIRRPGFTIRRQGGFILESIWDRHSDHCGTVHCKGRV